MSTIAETVSNKTDVTPETSILLIEDDSNVAEKLTSILKKQGYSVDSASCGAEGIEKLKNGSYSIIISDHNLSGMSGIEVLSSSHQIAPDTPRILLTADQDPNIITSAINEGKVSHIVYKPWNDATLLHVVQTGLKESLLVKQNREMEQKLLQQQAILSRTRNQLKSEMRVGRTVHEQFLMGSPPAQSKLYTLKATSIPSRELDGDFYNFYTPTEKHFDIVIGDVMGKGVAAALIGLAVKERCSLYAHIENHTKSLVGSGLWEEDLPTPLEIINGVHQNLISNLIQIEYFVTLLIGRFNHVKRSFSFVNCGLNPPMHYHAATNTMSYLVSQNPPIGSIEKHAYESTEVYYEKGDLFFFYSDGVTEARNPETNELYGIERLEAFIKQNINRDVSELMSSLIADIEQFTNAKVFEDDLTIIFHRIDDYYQVSRGGNCGSFMNEIEQLALVQEFVNRLCEKTPWSNEEFSKRAQLIVDEIFCNIIEHGQLGPQEEIRIEGDIQDDGLLIEICDQGPGFDPGSVAEPSFAGTRTGGFGSYLIRKMVSEASYVRKSRSDGWNRYKVFMRYEKS